LTPFSLKNCGEKNNEEKLKCSNFYFQHSINRFSEPEKLNLDLANLCEALWWLRRRAYLVSFTPADRIAPVSLEYNAPLFLSAL